MLKWYHPDAPSRLSTSHSLPALCDDPVLRDPSRRTVFSIALGVAFVPMSAARLSYDTAGGARAP